MSAGARPASETADLPPFAATDRILIVAPHPDDEALGCSGLILRAKKAGADLFVAVLTDGEAFESSVVIEEKTLLPSDRDRAEYGQKRQSETLAGMRMLGIPSQNVRFFGWPDRGLAEKWMSRDESGMTEELRQLIDGVRPTQVYVTHPLDDHADHSVAAAFVQAALLGSDVHPKLRTYLIHRGDWPLPQGLSVDSSLDTPEGFTDYDSLRLSLGKDEVEKKKLALAEYGSQRRLLGRFMESFIRRNELFFDAEKSPLLPKRDIGLGEPAADWTGLEPIAIDPSADSLVRQMNSGLDIERILAAESDDWIHFRIDFGGRIMRSGEYRLGLRAFDEGGETVGRYQGSVVPGRGHHGQFVHWSGNTLEWTVPRSLFPGSRTLAVQIETKVLGLSMDRSAIVFCRLDQ